MHLDGHTDPEPSAATLVVADWAIDAEAIVRSCAARGRTSPVHLVIPAWLHGLDWVGDPTASAPCALRQLERIAELCVSAGLRVETAVVGDPDPLSAIGDAVDAVEVDEIMLVARGRHVAAAYPFSVARRAERLTGLRVIAVAAEKAPRPPHRRSFASPHCAPATRLGY